MAVDLGDTVTTSIEVWTAPPELGGILTDASSITLTIRQPDTTVLTPTPVHTATGKYKYDFVTTQAGRYEARWATTGPATAYTDVVNVDAAVTGNLVSLGEAKEHLNIPLTDTSADEEIRRFVAVVSDFITRKTQPWTPVTYVETYEVDGYRPIILRHGPVGAVTSVTVNGVAVAPGYYRLGFGDLLYRTGYVQWSPWDTVTVTYTSGSATTPIPATVRHASLVMLAHLWSTQRGSSVIARPGGGGGGDEYDPRSTYSFPRAVAELLSDFMPAKGTGVWVG